MKTLLNLLFCLAIIIACNANGNSQILYGITNGNELIKIDVATCEVCPLLTLNGFNSGEDLTVLPNGNILVQHSGGQFSLYNPPDPNPILTVGGAFAFAGSILAPNGLIYISGVNPTGLFQFDPNTNTLTYIGNWPPDIAVSEFFYDNGQLYGFADFNGVTVLVEVNVINPDQSTILYNVVPFMFAGGITNGAYSTSHIGDFILSQYDLNTNTVEVICDLSNVPNLTTITALSNLPSGVSQQPCACITSAGTITNLNANVCVNSIFQLPHNGDEVLDNNDVLQYILFSDPNDTLGSILVTSNTPVFSFDSATMETNVTYYVAAIAGNNVNGGIDITDPCLSISNAATLTWRPLPGITLQLANNTVCGAGNCIDIGALLVGTAPFVFEYGIFYNGVQSGNSVTINAQDNSETFTVCPPETGQADVVVCSMQDAYCTIP
ncbi:MAG: hypothetical protein ACOYPR_17310 [Saprospiraceae bacterium]|jgi:hypothetical protein